MPSHQYKKSNYRDKTILVPSNLQNGIYFIGNHYVQLYWRIVQQSRNNTEFAQNRQRQML